LQAVTVLVTGEGGEVLTAFRWQTLVLKAEVRAMLFAFIWDAALLSAVLTDG
jgi:hypothetical protein